MEAVPLVPVVHVEQHGKALPASAVDALFLRRLTSLFVTCLVPSIRSPDVLLLVLLVAVVCGNQVLVYLVGLLPSQLIVGLIKRDTVLFMDVLWRAGLFTVGEALVVSFVAWLSGIVAMRWRRNLVTHLHSQYLNARCFFELNQQQMLDNPDQRVVQDATLLCTSLASYLRCCCREN
jgi:ABC-type uncharacterized transport system fused permease/ATPase subunit